MPFQKGQPRPPGAGRKKGVSARQAGITEFAQSIVEDPEYKKNLVVRAKGGTLAPGMETMLFHYAYGKPVEPQRDDDVFIAELLVVIGKYASSPEAQREIQEVVASYTTGGPALRAVA
jgi:hypothetical protein